MRAARDCGDLFFFQAEDGIRDLTVTGVQTCALPISGTSWLPDASPMHATHMVLGDWTLMLHGRGFAQYDWQGGPRGSDQVGVINWAMAAASRSLGGGRLELRGMLSAEPWTIGARGYPLLLQSGESYRGTPLHDRQHPHDLL